MKHCSKCNVDVNTDGWVCPLCNEVLVEKSDSLVTKANGYPAPRGRKHHPFLLKLFLFLSIIAIVICSYINIRLFDKSHPSYWSLAVDASIIFGWCTWKIFSNKKQTFVQKFFYLTMFTVALVIAIEFIFVLFNKDATMSWSLTYVFPCLIMLGLLVIQIVGYSSRRNFGDAVFNCFYLSLFSLIPLFLFIFLRSYVNVEWPPIAGVISSLATLLGFFIFRYRDSKEELKKRFNI